MKWLRRWFVPALVAVLSLTGLAAGEPTPQAVPQTAGPAADDKWLLDRSLTLTPQPAPKPALAYRLFPLASERKDGNAVPIYLRLVHEQNDAARRDWYETPLEWNKLPLNKVPLDDAKAFLKSHQRFLRQLELGARRKTAEWNYTLDEGSVVEILLPDAQIMRRYVPMLVLKVQVELAEGNFEAAAHWLETGFAFSQHVGKGPFFINGLVGLGCATQFADSVLDFVEQPDAPNLYWSLTALPRPLIDLRDSLEFEYRFVELQYPDLADLDRPRSPDQWDALLKKVRLEFQRLNAEGGVPPKPPAGTAPEDPASKSPDLPVALKYLTEQKKVAADKVAAMPPAQVLLLYLVGAANEFRDDIFKCFYLPLRNARQMSTEAGNRLKAAPETEAKRFSQWWLPAIVRVIVAHLRLERRLAALRVIEALRLHAAEHDGRLPDKLSEVTIVPVPDDPGTGKPFEYQKDGDTATLISHLTDDRPDPQGVRYRLAMRKK